MTNTLTPEQPLGYMRKADFDQMQNPGTNYALIYREYDENYHPVPVFASLPSPPVSGEALQDRVRPWMTECFGEEISADKLERGDRHLEEVLELLQSGDYPRERVAALTDYVYNRPKGEPSQEVGGVMITLAAYCLAHGLDMHDAGEVELARINRPEIIAKIRAKQAAKPTGSALPIAPSPLTNEPVWLGMTDAPRDGTAILGDVDGEVVTYAVFDKTGKLRFVAPNEHDAHMALILSSADPDEFDVATMVKPLYASPVQPVALEWRGSGLCFRDVVIATLERQNLSDPVQWVGRLGIGFDKLASIVWITGDVDNQSARERCKAETEQRARQWLSIGDK